MSRQGSTTTDRLRCDVCHWDIGAPTSYNFTPESTQGQGNTHRIHNIQFCLLEEQKGRKTGMMAGVDLGENKRLEGFSHLWGVGRIGRIGRIGRMWEGRIIADGAFVLIVASWLKPFCQAPDFWSTFYGSLWVSYVSPAGDFQNHSRVHLAVCTAVPQSHCQRKPLQSMT